MRARTALGRHEMGAGLSEDGRGSPEIDRQRHSQTACRRSEVKSTAQPQLGYEEAQREIEHAGLRDLSRAQNSRFSDAACNCSW